MTKNRCVGPPASTRLAARPRQSGIIADRGEARRPRAAVTPTQSRRVTKDDTQTISPRDKTAPAHRAHRSIRSLGGLQTVGRHRLTPRTCRVFATSDATEWRRLAINSAALTVRRSSDTSRMKGRPAVNRNIRLNSDSFGARANAPPARREVERRRSNNLPFMPSLSRPARAARQTVSAAVIKIAFSDKLRRHLTAGARTGRRARLNKAPLLLSNPTHGVCFIFSHAVRNTQNVYRECQRKML